MGVHGLWQLISSTGKPVPLDSLEGKVLAVDVSVWLHQLSKGMRDASGNPLPYAHLHGLFTRICKLLHYRIKPVFVFDGGVPALKKQTLASRRSRREDAEQSSTLMQQKILTNLIRSQALKEALGDVNLPKIPSSTKSSLRGGKDAMFELQPLPESAERFLTQNQHDNGQFDRRRELQLLVEDEYDDINDIDVDSGDFKALPAEIQYEIITDLKERKKNYNMSRMTEMPGDSQDFSNFQMAKLLKHGKLSLRLEDVRKDLNNTQTGHLGKYGEEYKGADVYSRRNVSDDSSHYILIKGLKNKRKMEEEKKRKEKEKIAEVEAIIEESSTDDLLVDSDHEELKQMNFLQSNQDSVIGIVSRPLTKLDKLTLNKDNLEEFLKSAGKNSQKTAKNVNPFENNNEPKLNKDDLYDFLNLAGKRKQTEGDKSDTVQTKGVKKEILNEMKVKPVYRPVIEIDTDSESEDESDNEDDNKKNIDEENDNADKCNPENLINSVERVEQVESYLLNTENDQQDRELQMAIEQSLNDQRNAQETDNKIHKKTKHKDYKTEQVEKLNTNGKNIPDKQSPTKLSASIFKRSISCLSNKSDGSLNKRVKLSEEEQKQCLEMESDSEQGSQDIQNESQDKTNPTDKHDNELNTRNEVEDSDSEDDFIEVKIDPTVVKEDEMFPASMFESPVKQELLTDDSNHIIDDENDLTTYTDDFSRISSDSEDDVTTMYTKSDDIIKTSTEDDYDSVIMSTKSDDVIKISDDVDDDVTDPDQSEAILVPSPSIEADVDESYDKPSSPRVPDLVQSFNNLNEQSVRGMRDNLAQETRQLQQERGRQERLAMSITDQMHSEAQELLQLFGIPYIVSPTEAEAQCAFLDLVNLTNGTITDDSDVWLFGGKTVYKNFFNLQKHVECFKSVNITSHLGLTRDSLINIALLCGSDYTQGIQGVGPVTAMEILTEFRGDHLEGLNKLKSWWDDTQKQIKIPIAESKLRAKLRTVDLTEGFPNPAVVEAYMCPEIDESTDKFTWDIPDLNLLRKFAGDKLGWTKEKTDELILPVLKRLNVKETQKKISSFFQPEIYIQPAKMKSKRLQTVVNQLLNPDTIPEKGEEKQTTVANDTTNKTQKTKPVRRARKKKVEDDVNEKTVNDVSEAVDEKANEIKDVNPDKSVKRKIPNQGQSKATRGGRGRGRGKGQGQTRSEYFESNKRSKIEVKEVDLSEGSSSVDSDSDSSSSSNSDSISGTSFDDFDNEIETPVINTGLNIAEILNLKMGGNLEKLETGSASYKEESQVIETGLNIEEILNLKMGDNLEKMATNNESGSVSNKLRVFQSDLDVKEIMNLRSGGKTVEINQELEDDSIDYTAIETDNIKLNIYKNESKTGKQELNEDEECSGERHEIVTGDSSVKGDSDQLNVEIDSDTNVDMFAGEGGFIREDDDVDSGTVTKTKPNKTGNKHDLRISEKAVPMPNLRKRSKKDLGESESTSEPVRKTRRSSRQVVVDAQVRKSTRNASLASKQSKEANTSDKRNELDNKNHEDTTNESQSIKNESTTNPMSDEKEETDSVSKYFPMEPIKTIVAGVPWADKGKRKGRSTKGKGSAKGISKIIEEPMKKRMKPKKPILNPIGCVNLSESDSD